MKSDIFISYRDSEINSKRKREYKGRNIAENILYVPMKREGYEVYFDPEKKCAGDYSKRLHEGVRNCKIFLWVLSKDCLICKTDDETKYMDWFYAEILWALENKKLIIPIISPEFQWGEKEQFYSNLKRVIHLLNERGKIVSSEDSLLKKAQCLYRLEGHMECINLDRDFKINNIFVLINRAKKQNRHIKKPIKFKKAKRTLLITVLAIMCTIFFIFFVGYNKKNHHEKEQQTTYWDGKMVLDDGWQSVQGNGTKESPYEIEDSNQLAWLAYSSRVNSYEGVYFELKSDIYLNEYHPSNFQLGNEKLISVNEKYAVIDVDNLHEWIPIGNIDFPFLGCFDGNGHTIKGLYINSNEDYQGLFGVCGEGSRIENINVFFSNITSDGQYIGAVAGRNDGLINNCNVYSAMIRNGSYVGGIVGKGNMVVNSYFNGIIVCGSEEKKCYGGIAGETTFLVNSSSSIYFHNNNNNCSIIGSLCGRLDVQSYNCVALCSPCLYDNGEDKKMELWGECSDAYNAITDEKSYNNVDDAIKFGSKMIFDEDVDYIFNENIKQIEKYNESKLYLALLEYGGNGHIIPLSKWISWKNPKGVWDDVTYAPYLESTYKAYDPDEWIR